MKVLVYGMGVIGGCLAHCLCDNGTGNEITVLARGAQKETLERDGLVIKNHFSKKKYIHKPRIISELLPDDCYDIIFVVMQYKQMQDVIPVVAANCSKNIVLIGNNMSAPYMEEELKKSGKTVIFGFQGTGGERKDGHYTYVAFGKPGMSVGCSSSDTKWFEMLRAALPEKSYRLTHVTKQSMPDWYASHLAFVLPVCFLCYKYDCNLRKVKKEDLNRVMDGCIEGYKLLKAAGYIVLDEDIDFFEKDRKKAYMFLWLCAKTKLGELVASNHAHNAVGEMKALSDKFDEIKIKAPQFKMPVWNEYEEYLHNLVK